MCIGIIYGSNGGTTQDVAVEIKEKLALEADLLDIADATQESFDKYEKFIIGTSTWGDGDLQDDWDDNLEVFQSANLSGKTIAFFGTGDQETYDDTFVDGMGILYEIAKDKGANIVGDNWSAEGYEFSESRSLVDGIFVGLALDEDNQNDQTSERIEKWVASIKNNFK